MVPLFLFVHDSPPPFLMGFPEAGGRFDPPTPTNLGLYLSAPFGAVPFYGYPILDSRPYSESRLEQKTTSRKNVVHSSCSKGKQ